MNRFGILGRYLPEFGRIVGQMQHDLFHIYTVDAHTLNLIKHLRKLRKPGVRKNSRWPAKLMATLPKPELIYLAGLYHDIGKGRAAITRNSARSMPKRSVSAISCPTWDSAA